MKTMLNQGNLNPAMDKAILRGYHSDMKSPAETLNGGSYDPSFQDSISSRYYKRIAPQSGVVELANCLYCGKEFKYLRWARERKYCSDSHRQLYCQSKKKHACLICGTTIDMRSTLCRKCSKIDKTKHPNWKGGLTTKDRQARTSIEYRLWREAVFARDNFTCQHCGKHGGYLEAHHIKGFTAYPELRFAIDNGLTLCKICHRKTY